MIFLAFPASLHLSWLSHITWSATAVSIVDWSVLPEEQWAVLGMLVAMSRVRVHSTKLQLCKLGCKGAIFPIYRYLYHFTSMIFPLRWFRMPLMGGFPLPCLPAQRPMSPRSAERLRIHPATVSWARFKIEDLGTKRWTWWTTGHCECSPCFTIPFWEFRFWPPFWTHNKIIVIQDFCSCLRVAVTPWSMA